MSYRLFESLILNEAPNDDLGIPEPPDFTNPNNNKKPKKKPQTPSNNKQDDLNLDMPDETDPTTSTGQDNTNATPDQTADELETAPDDTASPDQTADDLENAPDDGTGSGEEEGTGEEGMDDGMGGEDQLQSPVGDELKQMEQEVFADLKPEQIAIKILELKDNYKQLNDLVYSSIDKLNKASRTAYDSSMLDFIMNKLIKLEELSRDSLVKSFDTRTYIENKIEYQRMLMALNMIMNLINEIFSSRVKRTLKYDKTLGRKSSPVEFIKRVDTQ